MKKAYDSDLTVDQWEFLEPLIPVAKSGGRPRTTDMISVLNAIFYVVITLRVVSGGSSLMTFQPGQRFIAIFEHGAMMGLGATSTNI
jgi:hypothetical protein